MSCTTTEQCLTPQQKVGKFSTVIIIQGTFSRPEHHYLSEIHCDLDQLLHSDYVPLTGWLLDHDIFLALNLHFDALLHCSLCLERHSHTNYMPATGMVTDNGIALIQSCITRQFLYPTLPWPSQSGKEKVYCCLYYYYIFFVFIYCIYLLFFPLQQYSLTFSCRNLMELQNHYLTFLLLAYPFDEGVLITRPLQCAHASLYLFYSLYSLYFLFSCQPSYFLVSCFISLKKQWLLIDICRAFILFTEMYIILYVVILFLVLLFIFSLHLPPRHQKYHTMHHTVLFQQTFRGTWIPLCQKLKIYNAL